MKLTEFEYVADGVLYNTACNCTAELEHNGVSLKVELNLPQNILTPIQQYINDELNKRLK